MSADPVNPSGGSASPEAGVPMRLRLVALAYFGAQVLLLPMGRWWSWDEAISVSQVLRGVIAADFDPWRFRGVSLVVAPPALLGAPSTVVRLWLAAAASVALFAAFRTWIPVLGRAAVPAALIFAGSWLALSYGSEAMPNLWTAVCGVAAVGSALGRRRRSAVVTTAALAAMALFRLPDAIILATVLAGVAAVRRRPSHDLLAPLVGAAIGGLVWALDVGFRFGLSAAVRIAVESQQSERLVTVSGPARKLLAFFGWIGTNVPPPGFSPARWSLAGWALVIAIALVAAWRHPGAVRLAVVSGILLAAPYVALIGPVVPRYLLPSLGLLAVGAAAGLADLATWMEQRAGGLVRGAGAALVAALLLANVSGARQALGDVVELRAIDRSVGGWVTRTLGEPAPGSCILLVVGNAPALGIATPCRARLFYPPGDAYRGQSATSLREAVAVAETGGAAYIVRVWPGPPPEGVTLEPVDGSDLADLYRVVPVGP